MVAHGYTPINGTGYGDIPYTEVDFVWLIYPIVIYLGLTIFLFATIFRTIDTPPWKASPTAFLRCMDPDNDLSTAEIIKDYEKKRFVRLEETGKTWHLAERKIG